jgi:hypothetical protein
MYRVDTEYGGHWKANDKAGGSLIAARATAILEFSPVHRR